MREPVDVADAVELAFGDNQDRAPDAGVPSPSSGELRAPTTVPCDPCDLEGDLASILEDDGFTCDCDDGVRSIGSEAEPEEEIAEQQVYWIQCSKCDEWRQTPRGTYLTFDGKDAKFYCRFASADCRLTKRRRRA